MLSCHLMGRYLGKQTVDQSSLYCIARRLIACRQRQCWAVASTPKCKFRKSGLFGLSQVPRSSARCSLPNVVSSTSVNTWADT